MSPSAQPPKARRPRTPTAKSQKSTGRTATAPPAAAGPVAGPATGIGLAPAAPVPVEMPRLHVPDEPVDRKHAWLEGVNGGAPLSSVLHGTGSFDEWLWRRWRSLAAVGVTEELFVAVVEGYRREIWLWLAGERTWAQCCSGLVGRLARRAPR